VLFGGVATGLNALFPGLRFIGVERVHAPTLKVSLQAGHVTRIDTTPTLADGLAVGEVGKLCFEIARNVMDDLVMVDEAQIALSILRLLELEKAVIEGAGAVPLAAALARSLSLEGKKVVLCLCGGNIDVTTISRVIERGLVADGRLCRVTATISDRPGSLARLATVLASTGASVKDVEHERSFGPRDVGNVSVAFTLETRDSEHIGEVHAALDQAGIQFQVE
jgi:threonine dehydratase